LLFILFLIIHSNFNLTKPRCKYTNISVHTRKIFIFFRFFMLKHHQTNCHSPIINNQVTCPPLLCQHEHNNLQEYYQPTQWNGATQNSKKNFCKLNPYIVPTIGVNRGVSLPAAAARPSSCLPGCTSSSISAAGAIPQRCKITLHRRRCTPSKSVYHYTLIYSAPNTPPARHQDHSSRQEHRRHASSHAASIPPPILASSPAVPRQLSRRHPSPWLPRCIFFSFFLCLQKRKSG
jgi:hypothetical protein